uniref:Uncharacterized protein n=1 Tax=Sphaerodactylus townsendi TaxID=933632 RepID=A0ACB8EJN6_9SAUR
MAIPSAGTLRLSSSLPERRPAPSLSGRELFEARSAQAKRLTTSCPRRRHLSGEVSLRLLCGKSARAGDPGAGQHAAVEFLCPLEQAHLLRVDSCLEAPAPTAKSRMHPKQATGLLSPPSLGSSTFNPSGERSLCLGRPPAPRSARAEACTRSESRPSAAAISPPTRRQAPPRAEKPRLEAPAPANARAGDPEQAKCRCYLLCPREKAPPSLLRAEGFPAREAACISIAAQEQAHSPKQANAMLFSLAQGEGKQS